MIERKDHGRTKTSVQPITKAQVEASLQTLYPDREITSLLKAVPNAQLFVYGGLLRDIYLDRPPKEADFLLISDRTKNDFEAFIESYLGEQGLKMLGKTEWSNYHYLPYAGAGIDSVIDINLGHSRGNKTIDFTMNSLYFDLGASELIDEYDGRVDLERKVVKAVIKPEELFSDKPITIFRAIKCVCQFGFTLDPDTRDGLLHSINHTRELLDYIADNTHTLLGEWMLDNIFRSLKYDPKKYVSLCDEFGITVIMLRFVADRLGVTYADVPASSLLFKTAASSSYEDNLSIFLSFLADNVSQSDKEETFGQLLKLFGITRAYSYHAVGIKARDLSYIARTSLSS